MGGSFSEPATLVDLGESVYRLYTDGGATARRVGWALDKARPDQLVQGLQHVGDAAIFSEVFCSECLLRGTQKLCPRDVGVSLEETGSKIRFLHVDLAIGPGPAAQAVVASPASQNEEFARGGAAYPHISRLGPYLGTAVHNKKIFHQFVRGRVISFNYAADGKVDEGRVAFIDLCRNIAP